MASDVPLPQDVAELARNLPAVRPMGAPLVILDDEGISRIATRVARSGIAPKSYRRGAEGQNGKRAPATENDPVDEDMVYIGIMHGQEVGLKPMQALQSIGVINGIPALYGDGALAVVLASGLVQLHEEWPTSGDIVGSDQQGRPVKATERVIAYTCRFQRRGQSVREHTFTVDDARRANLWGKQGPWQQYPDRMLQMRARAFLMRDVFADVLKGLAIYEEAIDIGNLEVVQKPAPATSQAIRGRSRDAMDAFAKAQAQAVREAEPVQDAEFQDAVDPDTGEITFDMSTLPKPGDDMLAAAADGKFNAYFAWATDQLNALPIAAAQALAERDREVWVGIAKLSVRNRQKVLDVLSNNGVELNLDA